MTNAEEVVRTYLTALRDPDTLKDDRAIEKKTAELENTDDVITQLHLREELNRLRSPSLAAVEDEFVVHAKSWAEEDGIGVDAFAAQGVPNAVLRRAGFQVGRSSAKKSAKGRKSSGKRVRTEEVIDAMPSTAFTVQRLRELSGASQAVVRKAIKLEMGAGRLAEVGTDPDHSGPGRAPTLHRKT